MRVELVGSLLATVLAISLVAQAQQPPANGQNQFVLRTYDVGDLVMSISDHTYSETTLRTSGGLQAPGAADTQFSTTSTPRSPRIQFAQFGGGGGGFGGGGFVEGGGGRRAMPANGAELSVTLDDLINGIAITIAPDTWVPTGGEGQITAIGSSLVVRQTPEVHQMIEGLLEALRSGSGKRQTLRVDARWLLLMSDDLDKLLAGDEGKLDRETLEFLTRQPATIRGITNCFSGQLVYLVSGTRRNVVRSYIPVVGSVDRSSALEPQFSGSAGPVVSFVSDQSAFASDRSVGYQPIVDTPNFGALLEIRPTVVPGDQGVTVDLKSTITVPSERKDTEAIAKEADRGAPVVDRIAIETQEFATTLRMPLGEPFLVGGMTYSPTVSDLSDQGRSAGKEGEKPQLYLILELR